MPNNTEEVLVSVKVDTGDSTEKINNLAAGIEKGVGGALDKVAPGVNSFISGMKGMVVASLEFLATPIGLVLGAIGLALGALTTYFKDSGDGANKFAVITAYVSGIIEVLKDHVIAVGRALFKAFEDPKQALKDFGEFIVTNIKNRIDGMLELIPALGKAISLVFEGEWAKAGKVAADAMGKVALGVTDLTDKLSTLTDEVVRNANENAADEKALQRVTQAERDYELQASRTKLEIQRLILESKNRLLTEQQKIDILDKAAKLEEQQNKTLAGLRMEQLKLIQNDVQDRIGLNKMAGESLEAYSRRLVDFNGKSGMLTAEDKKRVIDALKAVNEARGESLVLQEKILNRQDALRLEQTRKQEVADKKAADDAKALAEERLKLSADEWKQKTTDAQIANDEMAAAALKEFNAEKKMKQLMHDTELSLVDSAFKHKQGIRIAATALLKSDTLKEIWAGTAKAAVNWMAAAGSIPVIGWILGPIAYAAAWVIGAAAAASVVGITFGKGGQAWGRRYDEGGSPRWSTIGGQGHDRGGTKFWGTDGTHFEAQSDEGLFILKREAHANFISSLSKQNQAFGGNAWMGGHQHLALGGEIAVANNSRSGNLMANKQMDSLVKAILQMPAPRVAVDDINTGQNRKQVVVDQANFL